MTIEEAEEMLKKGKKITHSFMHSDHAKLKDSKVVNKEGREITLAWDNGYAVKGEENKEKDIWEVEQ